MSRVANPGGPKMGGTIISKMEPELEAAVRAAAEARDMTMSSFVRQAIRHELARIEGAEK